MKLYGITNCDTVKKATGWLKQNRVAFEFHDCKKSGIAEEKLREWTKELGWEKLINKKGTTWRTLTADEQQEVMDEKSAIALMVKKPSVIKRPVIEMDGKLLIGFDEELYKTMLKK